MHQLLVVLTKAFSSKEGILFAFAPEMDKPLFSFPVTLGKNGMAWGRGEHAYWILSGRHKREGDERTPAGLFKLGKAFGREKPKACQMPFLHIEAVHHSVDDPASRFYNIIVNEEEVVKDWKSAESMVREDELYDLGIVVDHNANPVTRGLGSCIFFHLWKNRDTKTAGCTAMPRADMLKLLEWLDPRYDPLLLQLPQEAYPTFLSSLLSEPMRRMVTRRLSPLIKAYG